MPAAFEALQEMNQVGRPMERLAARAPPCSPLRRPAVARGQALSQEVVALMVDNIAQDPRLLPPVQQVVRAWSPPSCNWPWPTRGSSATATTCAQAAAGNHRPQPGL